jgi:hypothetical protein
MQLIANSLPQLNCLQKITMNYISVFITVILLSAFKIGMAQNVSINVLTLDAGIVKKDKSVLFEVAINNTDNNIHVGIYKLKVQISVADSTLRINNSGHNLPTGWKILSNDGKVLTLSNGKDLIASNDVRKIYLSIQGIKIGGPALITGQLSFSNGVEPGNEIGSLKGDYPADNFSTSSCKVID